MVDTTTRVDLFRRTSKSGSLVGKEGLYLLGEKDRIFNKPTLLCCGGIAINKHHLDPETDENDCARLASGFAKIGHALLGYKDHITADDPIDIVSVAYPEKEETIGEQLERYHGQMFCEQANYSIAAEHFVQDHLSPLIKDGNGKLFNLMKIKRNLRNINVLAHSYGGAFIQQVGNALYSEMHELGFSPKEIEEATSQILVVVAGTGAVLAGGQASFTTIDILNADDKISGQFNPGHYDQSEMIHELFSDNGYLHKAEKKLPAKSLTVIPARFDIQDEKAKLIRDPKSHQYLVYASPPLVYITNAKTGNKHLASMDAIDPDMMRSNKCGFFYDEANDSPFDVRKDKDRHEVETYFHFGAGHHGFMLRTIVSSVLANGINNGIENSNRNQVRFSKLPQVKQLLQCPKELQYPLNMDFTKIAHMIGYNQRINDSQKITFR